METAAEGKYLHISFLAVSYAIGEIEILSAYTPSKGCPRRRFQPRIRTMTRAAFRFRIRKGKNC